MNKTQIQEFLVDLQNFTGSEHLYKNFTGIKFTDGVKHLADSLGAYWLIDAIGSYTKTRVLPFQSWILEVNKDKSAVLKMQTDKGKPFIIRQEIEYTDFPLEKINLWLIDGILILPGEY